MKRKQIIKRALCMALSCAMVVTSFTGCGKGGSSSEDNENSALISELAKKYKDVTDLKEITNGVTLTIAVPQSSKVLDYDTNNQTLLIEEALGVDLKFMALPSADYASKLNVMVKGGEQLPDIIFDPTGWESWIEEDVIFDLREFYANPTFSANIKAGSERSGLDIEKYMTRPDGAMYALPKLNQELYAPVQQKLWVYQPWLDALGEKVPETTEEFYQICKKVASTDLNGNGKNDEIGITGYDLTQWFDCLMSGFVYAHEGDWRVVEDGKVSFAFTTDEWKNGLKYIKKFFDDGLIPKETLSQGSDQYRILYNSDTPVLFSFADWNYTGTDLNRRREYTVVPALKGPDGVQYSCNIATIPTTGAVITTDCENPLAAFIVCDYMCNKEMSVSQRYGEQGVDWDFWDVAQTKVGNTSEFVPTFEGYDISFYAYNMIEFWNSNEAQNKCYRKAGPMMLDVTLSAGAAVWKDAADETTRINAELELITAEAAMECYEYQPKEVYDFAPLTTDENDDVGDIKAAIQSYVTEMTSAFLSGEKDIDKEWNSYIKELENIGYKDYLEVLQTAYDRVH